MRARIPDPSNDAGFSHDDVVKLGAVMELPASSLPGAARYCIRRFGYARSLSFAQRGVRYIYQLDELIEAGLEPEDLDVLRGFGSIVDDYLAMRIGPAHLTMALANIYSAPEG
jgi:hypothetical protein